MKKTGISVLQQFRDFIINKGSERISNKVGFGKDIFPWRRHLTLLIVGNQLMLWRNGMSLHGYDQLTSPTRSVTPQVPWHALTRPLHLDTEAKSQPQNLTLKYFNLDSNHRIYCTSPALACSKKFHIYNFLSFQDGNNCTFQYLVCSTYFLI